MRKLLLLVALFSLVSCNQKKEPEQVKEIDMNFYKPNGERVGRHKDADGIEYSDWDVLAPCPSSSFRRTVSQTSPSPADSAQKPANADSFCSLLPGNTTMSTSPSAETNASHSMTWQR